VHLHAIGKFSKAPVCDAMQPNSNSIRVRPSSLIIITEESCAVDDAGVCRNLRLVGCGGPPVICLKSNFTSGRGTIEAKRR
jgi:hypothetical protein